GGEGVCAFGCRRIDLPGDGPCAVEIEVDDCDMRTFLCEALRSRGADPARSTDDDRDLPIEVAPRLRAFVDLSALERPVLHFAGLRSRQRLEALNCYSGGH